MNRFVTKWVVSAPSFAQAVIDAKIELAKAAQ